MNKYTLSLFFVLCTSLVFAQNIKNKYSFHSGENGSVYFVHPIKALKNESIPSDLEYDLTYNSATDSVTYNFTFFNKIVSTVESISFNNEPQKFEASMLFVDPHKNSWKLRATVKLPFEYIKNIYNNTKPYTLMINTNKAEYRFSQNEKNWQKQSAIVNKIFEVIKYNANK